MQQWEYTVVNISPGDDWDSALQRWGEEGWEAWHMEDNERGWRKVYFKRPGRAIPKPGKFKLTPEELDELRIQGGS